MASDREPSHSKRPHVKTERMQEFIKAQEESLSPHKKLKCSRCDKVFSSAPGLKYHVQTHSEAEPRYSCQKCHKEFKSANGLKYHMGKTKCEDTDSWAMEQDINQEFGDQTSIPVKSVPPPLSLTETAGGIDKLTELAIIATGPQSPLLQKPHPPPWDPKPGGPVRCLNKEMELYDESGMVHHLEHKYERNGRVKQESQPEDYSCGTSFDGSDPKVSTSSPLPLSPDDEKISSTTWSHSWPTAVWQCFITGTRIKFLDGRSGDWENVELIAQKEQLAIKAHMKRDKVTQSFAPNGLRVKKIGTVDGADQSEIEIQFSPDIQGQMNILAKCQRNHPFFVKDKGWSSVYPQETVHHYGIPCSELNVNDVCLPPSHPEATFSKEVFRSFEEYDFTPEDTSAVFALSSMKQRKESDLSPKAGSVPKRKSTKSESPLKSKRPMNAFFLFAKEFRLRYTQMLPKRDNRAISVALGEKWKELPPEDRQVYEDRARTLADQQKKINPDCWKRKK